MYHNLIELLQKQIVYLDGAMGTMIQRYNLTESDFRGEKLLYFFKRILFKFHTQF